MQTKIIGPLHDPWEYNEKRDRAWCTCWSCRHFSVKSRYLFRNLL